MSEVKLICLQDFYDQRKLIKPKEKMPKPTERSDFNCSNVSCHWPMTASLILSWRGMSLSTRVWQRTIHNCWNSGHSTTWIDWRHVRMWKNVRLSGLIWSSATMKQMRCPKNAEGENDGISLSHVLQRLCMDSSRVLVNNLNVYLYFITALLYSQGCIL